MPRLALFGFFRIFIIPSLFNKYEFQFRNVHLCIFAESGFPLYKAKIRQDNANYGVALAWQEQTGVPWFWKNTVTMIKIT